MSSTILLIEDNSDMTENICAILGLANYEVLTAPNGKVGVEMALKKLPDMIICDIMMPELDGYGVLQILNGNPATKRIPFVFLTAKSDKNEIRSGMNLGADDYITKPFDGFDLLKVIEIRLKKCELARSEFKSGGDMDVSFEKQGTIRDFQKFLENRGSRIYRRKEFIFMEGQSASDLFYIRKGKVKTYKLNYEGKELITDIHGGGTFLGYVPLLESKPHHENAEVLEDSEIVFVPKQDFINLVYSNKDVARKFIEYLSRNLSEAENRLLNLAYQSVRQRVAGVLIRLAETGGSSESTSYVSTSRRDLSTFIGTATESLNRTLADFKEEGIIEIGDDGIKILNKRKLEGLFR